MKSKHTKGPWTVGVSIDLQGWPVFRIRDMGDRNAGGDECQADRALIEAAPELLEACKALRACVGAFVDERGSVDLSAELVALNMANAAIHKAESAEQKRGA